MIFQSIDEIKDKILHPENRDFINRGQEIKCKHELHVNGIGLDKFLKKLIGVENPKALALRKQLTDTFTVPIISNALKPVDKVFSARGTYRYYDFSDNGEAEMKFKEILKAIQLDVFISQKWRNLSFVDPCGLIMLEVEEDGISVEPCYESIDCIHSIEFESQTRIDYVIFTPEIESNVSTYRVIDDAYDYIVIRKGDNFAIDQEKTIKNVFGYVPACFISDRFDKKEDDCFDTYISESMVSCDQYLRDASIHEVYKVKQGFPYVWEISVACSKCGGSKVDDVGETCTLCSGTGIGNQTRDIADKIVINPDMADKDLRPVAGYIQPDLETWKQQTENLKSLEFRINAAIWGQDSAEVNRQNVRNTTAFEISVSKQGQYDKLTSISKCAETIEKFITDLIGKFYFPTLYKSSSINYSKRFNLQTPEEIFTHYIDAKKNGVNSTILGTIYEEYLNVLYENNKIELDTNLMKLWTKPLFHYTGKELSEFSVDENDYKKNIYYDEFIVEYEKTKPLYLSTIEEVQTKLDQFVTTKKQPIQQPNTVQK
jgi:hypothetical protein